MGTKSVWTPERGIRQAETISQTKPWKASTGPRMWEGQTISSRNTYAGDWYHEALAQLADAKSGALAVLGRKRFSKFPPPDTRRTRAFRPSKNFH